ncbi:PaaI family thioesterase [Tistrella mobilis]|uniref:PaaI family thioesterase n=1 Tax=Tistrella mobilis TaxID=171437 RepID=UPI003558C789
MSDTIDPGTTDAGTTDAGARLQAFVLSMPAARLLGFDFLDVAPGHVVLDLPFRPELGEHQGLFQGGILGALVDFAGASANATLLGPSEALMTLDYTVKLLRPARAAGLRATGRVIDGGGRIGVASAELFLRDADGRVDDTGPIATGLVSTRRVDLRPRS